MSSLRKYAPIKALQLVSAANAIEGLLAHPTSTLSAPSGVTSTAGANAYAAVFINSPDTTAPVICQLHSNIHSIFKSYTWLSHTTTTDSVCIQNHLP
jgi:hypothetical protein